MSIIPIIKGHLNEAIGKNQELFEERYAICAKCPERQDGVFELCGVCGCRLQAKLRVEGERCPERKWLAYFKD